MAGLCRNKLINEVKKYANLLYCLFDKNNLKYRVYILIETELTRECKKKGRTQCRESVYILFFLKDPVARHYINKRDRVHNMMREERAPLQQTATGG